MADPLQRWANRIRRDRPEKSGRNRKEKWGKTRWRGGDYLIAPAQKKAAILARPPSYPCAALEISWRIKHTIK